MTPAFANIVNRYLNSEIPYALLIDGKWGSGKTWYLKNKFEDDFGREIIYTSANGITSMDDLTQQILYRKLYLSSKLVNDPKAKLAYSIVKEFGKSMLNKYTGFNVDEFSKLDVNLNDFASISDNEVLIIDDIERMSGDLIEELLGFVSKNFTEENGFKVILVADEQMLIEKPGGTEKKYLQIKEKTIWQTVNFQLDYEKVIPSLTSTHLNKIIEIYPDFNKDVIFFLKQHKISNLRTILYAFSCIGNVFLKVNDNNILPVVVKSILIFTNEYKIGKLNTRIGEVIPDYIKTTTPSIFGNLGNEEEFQPSDSDIFSQLYLNDSHIKYYYFESLYYLVCHGLLYDDLLLKELENFKKLKEIPDLALNAIQKMFSYRQLSDIEFNDTFKEVLGYFNDGKYDVYSAINIIVNFNYFIKIGILDFTIEDFELRLDENIAKINIELESTSIGFRHLKPEDFSYLNEEKKYYDLLEAKFEEKKQKSMANQKKTFIIALKEENDLEVQFSYLFVSFSPNELDELVDFYVKNPSKLQNLHDYFRDDKDSINNLEEESLKKYHYFIAKLKEKLVGKKIALSIVSEIENLKK